MSAPTEYLTAVPVLASLDIERSAEFFAVKLGFMKIHVAQGVYGVVANGPVQIHFWACVDRSIAEATSCRVQVRAIEHLYHRCEGHFIVHPKAPLETKEWGTREFAILDPDGNLITFYEATDA